MQRSLVEFPWQILETFLETLFVTSFRAIFFFDGKPPVAAKEDDFDFFPVFSLVSAVPGRFEPLMAVIFFGGTFVMCFKSCFRLDGTIMVSSLFE